MAFSTEGNRGWVSFKDGQWEECDVVNSDDKSLTLKVKGGGEQKVQRSKVAFHYRNPTSVELADDFLTLPNLDEPNILHSLRQRYWAQEVYSHTGPILIAVNPWKKVSIYELNVLEQYKSNPPKTKKPHIFGLAAKSFQDMLETRKNQCILISGESGSGKTESTKFVLQVLTAVDDNKTGASASICSQVMLTNPVLEAFGNAKTLRNDNSSRFGKWINVHFERKGTVSGAEIKTYLLEKARVIHQTEGERNYHIFYQACQSCNQHSMLQDLGFQTADKFEYTKVCLHANNTDDVKSFERTKQALHFIKFNEQSQTNIFSAVSAVLWVGNIKIEEDREGHASMVMDAATTQVGKLLQLAPEDIKTAICCRNISAGGETMVKPENKEKATQCRDALSKALYSKLFDNIVVGVNIALKLKGENQTMQVSVLDIFGFEVFKENRFEQFCINYANEKLQLHFNHFNFMLERQLYEREGIELVESDFVDNSKCVELIEGKGWGIQACLDDICIMPKGDDQAFLGKLVQNPQMKNHPHFGAPKQRSDSFVVNHYAGTVAYTVAEFCEKNKDILAADLVNLLLTSKSDYFRSLFETQATDATPSKPGRKGGGSVAYKSVSAVFKTDLASLMEAINAADPHFVRCVNPNAQKKADYFEDQKAVEQLRCGGVIEAVRMCRESYPSRYIHSEFVGTFACICPSVSIKDGRDGCEKLIREVKVDPKQYRLGKTMILLKRQVVDQMEKMRAKLLGGRAITLQNCVRNYLSKLELAKKREIRKKYLAIVYLQSASRRTLTRAKYVRMLQAVRAQDKRKQDRRDSEMSAASKAEQSQVAKNSRDAVLQGLGDDSDDEEGGGGGGGDVEVEGYVEDEEEKKSKRRGGDETSALRAQDDAPPVSPLCIRIQVHAEGITEALLFHVDLLASAIRQAVMIKDHKSFLKVHPNTFRGQAAIEWLRGHAARALFGSEAEKEKNQQLSRSVALLLGQKLLAVGVFRQVTGSLTKPLEDPNALFRFHEDEKEGPLLNCRSIWFQNAREPLLVVSELLYTMLTMRLKNPEKDIRDMDELNNFTASAAELQLVNINDLSRIQLLAFFLNAYNLMVLHAHVVRGSVDGQDFKSQKIPFTRDNQYMIAAYNYSLAEIEERLFCRMLRAKFPKKSDKSRAPEPRVHFALSLGCASSARIRIYQPETLDEDLQQAAVEYLTTNAPKNRVRMQQQAQGGKKVHEVMLPKLFKWYKDDFGFSKQEILAYYASFMPSGMREELTEVARTNSFIIKYDKYDWNLHLSKACSEVVRQPGRAMITNSASKGGGGGGGGEPSQFNSNQQGGGGGMDGYMC